MSVCLRVPHVLPFLTQSLVARLKENVEKLTEERDQRSASEIREKEQNKRFQRQVRDIKEEMAELAKKEAEASRKKHELVSPQGHLPSPGPPLCHSLSLCLSLSVYCKLKLKFSSDLLQG